NGVSVRREPETVSWTAEMAEREGYPHFMLKEIYEQPRAIRDTLAGRIGHHGEITLAQELNGLDLVSIDRIVMVACGTSYHAGLVGKFMIESIVRMPVDVEYASEFRYRKPLIDNKTLVVGISQSGETAD